MRKNLLAGVFVAALLALGVGGAVAYADSCDDDLAVATRANDIFLDQCLADHTSALGQSLCYYWHDESDYANRIVWAACKGYQIIGG